MYPQDTIKTSSRRKFSAGDWRIRYLPPTLVEGAEPRRLECAVEHSVALEIRHADGSPLFRLDARAKLTVVPEAGSIVTLGFAPNDHFVEHPLHRP